MEIDPPAVDRGRILDLLMRAEIFEQVLQPRYLGNKRFSIEGVDALLPLLDEALSTARRAGRRAGGAGDEPPRPAERHDPHRRQAGGRDLRRLRGRRSAQRSSAAATSSTTSARPASSRARNGRTVNIHLVSNPSHLEAVDPVAMGRVRAKQDRLGDAQGRAGRADHHPRRRRLRRPGDPRRDAQPRRRCPASRSAARCTSSSTT